MYYKVFEIDWKNKKLISTGQILNSSYTDIPNSPTNKPWIKDKNDEGGKEISFDKVKKQGDEFSFTVGRGVSGVVGMAFELWRENYPKKGLVASLNWHILEGDKKLEEWIVKTLMVKELEKIKTRI